MRAHLTIRSTPMNNKKQICAYANLLLISPIFIVRCTNTKNRLSIKIARIYDDYFLLNS